MKTPDPLLYPSPERIARAVVAACGVTHEDPAQLAAKDADDDRFRLATLQALNIAFPAISWLALGDWLNINKPVARLHQAKKAPWWPNEGARAVEAALTALEGT